MAKKDKAVYAPGELDRVRSKLGDLDQQEAKRLAEKLGGEVGFERTEDQEKARQKPKRTRHERVDVKIGNQPSSGSRTPRHRVELATDADYDESKRKPPRRKEADPSDDPSVPIKTSYWDRIKLDKYAGQPEFDIKSSGQILFSMLSFFGEIPDYVGPSFITRRMPEYYKKIETLVVSTRSLFPRNNARRSERMKKTAPLVFSILDTIRYWNIERISSDLARLQAHPRNVKVSDFADILRSVYKPLFVLDQLDLDSHIRAAYKILYKALYIENPMEAQNKYQDLIRVALASFTDVKRDVRFLLYPLLLKTVSSKWVAYERLFIERKNRIMAFLNVAEEDQINPAQIVASEAKPGEEEAPADEVEEVAEGEEEVKELTEEEKTQRAAAETEKKAVDRGLQTLEAFFPKAGWDRLSSYPDLYPYFVDIFDLKKGIVNIAPTDPLQQIFILMRILEELFFGLRYVSFGAVPGSGGNPERVDEILTDIINNWHYYIEFSFEKEYLPRMTEYIRILEGSAEERSSSYSKKILTDLHWTKRLYFLPYYKFESISPPPFQKKDINPIYPEIKRLRRYLTAVAAGIEQGLRAGGAEKHAPCDGIDNPWEPYVFQVPNPLSIRMEALLSPKNKNNASLVFFTLAVSAVLDHLVNSEDSWAYSPRPGPLFRSIGGEGLMPLTGVDTKIDADAIFKAAVRQRQKQNPPQA
ncbi:hypothetical protein [Leadbettera azotonutricia]|uniref:Uncharacterized protein n=1 Tax=Leadbettera azotonutricia (strain ATCC BAA-888 / DSM 13862 / ZAS-9) TaxID=545695 RepID=F5Y7G9_LEAAZ|nr:hypothetical protein [Leadbettera azotonutricia]AEF81643.1 hypothetical protein TREAZ_2333 [Leadbettera azotonutricia ZAS-9]